MHVHLPSMDEADSDVPGALRNLFDPPVTDHAPREANRIASAGGWAEPGEPQENPRKFVYGNICVSMSSSSSDGEGDDGTWHASPARRRSSPKKRGKDHRTNPPSPPDGFDASPVGAGVAGHGGTTESATPESETDGDGGVGGATAIMYASTRDPPSINVATPPPTVVQTSTLPGPEPEQHASSVPPVVAAAGRAIVSPIAVVDGGRSDGEGGGTLANGSHDDVVLSSTPLPLQGSGETPGGAAEPPEGLLTLHRAESVVEFTRVGTVG